MKFIFQYSRQHLLIHPRIQFPINQQIRSRSAVFQTALRANPHFPIPGNPIPPHLQNFLQKRKNIPSPLIRTGLPHTDNNIMQKSRLLQSRIHPNQSPYKGRLHPSHRSRPLNNPSRNTPINILQLRSKATINSCSPRLSIPP